MVHPVSETGQQAIQWASPTRNRHRGFSQMLHLPSLLPPACLHGNTSSLVFPVFFFLATASPTPFCPNMSIFNVHNDVFIFNLVRPCHSQENVSILICATSSCLSCLFCHLLGPVHTSSPAAQPSLIFTLLIHIPQLTFRRHHVLEVTLVHFDSSYRGLADGSRPSTCVWVSSKMCIKFNFKAL